MSDSIKIALIVAATLSILFLVFRTRLTRLLIRFKGAEAQLDANPPHQGTATSGKLLITKNKQVGSNNRIEASNASGEISENLQKGDANSLSIDKFHR